MNRFVAIMAPAAVKLQRLLQLPRFRSPQSLHESAFKQQYYGKITAAAALLQSPDEDALATPERAAVFLKGLASSVGKFVRSAYKSFLRIVYLLIQLSCIFRGRDFALPCVNISV